MSQQGGVAPAVLTLRPRNSPTQRDRMVMPLSLWPLVTSALYVARLLSRGANIRIQQCPSYSDCLKEYYPLPSSGDDQTYDLETCDDSAMRSNALNGESASGRWSSRSSLSQQMYAVLLLLRAWSFTQWRTRSINMCLQRAQNSITDEGLKMLVVNSQTGGRNSDLQSLGKRKRNICIGAGVVGFPRVAIMRLTSSQTPNLNCPQKFSLLKIKSVWTIN